MAGRFAPVADGNIRWPAVPGLIGEKRKGDRFLGFRREAEFVGEAEVDVRAAPVDRATYPISVGFFAPPPETINSWHALRCASQHMKRRTASAIDRAVRAVAVATTSTLLAPRQSCRNRATIFAPELLATGGSGGFCGKMARARSCPITDPARGLRLRSCRRGHNAYERVPPSPRRSPCSRARCRRQ